MQTVSKTKSYLGNQDPKVVLILRDRNAFTFMPQIKSLFHLGGKKEQKYGAINLKISTPLFYG